MGKWYDTKITLKKSDFQNPYHIHKISIFEKDNSSKAILSPAPNLKYYIEELESYTSEDKIYLACTGDSKLDEKRIKLNTKSKETDLPILTKASWAGSKRMGIILKFGKIRHWILIAKHKPPGVKDDKWDLSYIKNFDSSWESKIDNVIWRGAATTIYSSAFLEDIDSGFKISSEFTRFKFIKDYYKDYNIGFSNFPDQKPHPSWLKLKKEKVSYRNQLKNKYIISLEGNDVASGLKWQLLSNSVVIMSEPTKISWAMEDTLVPYEHYVPLADTLDNLEEVIQWCRENDSTCKEISENATQYMQKFLDHDNESLIHQRIISKYDKNIKWI